MACCTSKVGEFAPGRAKMWSFLGAAILLAISTLGCGPSESASPVGTWEGKSTMPANIKGPPDMPAAIHFRLELSSDGSATFEGSKGEWKAESKKVTVTFVKEPLLLKFLHGMGTATSANRMDLELTDEGKTLLWPAGPGEGSLGLRFVRMPKKS